MAYVRASVQLCFSGSVIRHATKLLSQAFDCSPIPLVSDLRFVYHYRIPARYCLSTLAYWLGGGMPRQNQSLNVLNQELQVEPTFFINSV